MIKIGLQLAGLGQPFKQALHTAARLGAEAVEIDARGEINPAELSGSGRRQLRKMLDDLNLRVCAIGFHTRRGYNVPEELERRVAATRRAMTFAYDLGASVVVNHVGRIPEEPQGPEWHLLLETLEDLGRFGQHAGVHLAAETGSEPGPRLKSLLDALPPGSLAVNFDPGNLVLNGHSVEEAFSALADAIVHVHAKDGTRDAAQGRGVEVPLGRGMVDFPLLVAQLEQRGYAGYYTIERLRAADPPAEFAQAISYLRRLM